MGFHWVKVKDAPKNPTMLGMLCTMVTYWLKTSVVLRLGNPKQRFVAEVR
jgi:hypothetical protein